MRKIVFITGTRADYGKIKSLIKILSPYFEYHIFVCGMHLLKEYGETFLEIKKDGFENIFLANSHQDSLPMDISLSKTIEGFSQFIAKIKPDLIIVHGDRLEALAGAIVGAFNNIMVAHIEGGEVSGTIDESIRHSISKLAHIHFTANQEASKRLVQLGENPDFIFEIGSPDIDIMLDENLPTLQEVAKYYQISFLDQPTPKPYSIGIYHPVTTEIQHLKHHIKAYLDALIQSQRNYILIYPNNDLGSKIILSAFKELSGYSNFAIYPSIRFEKFLTLLKYADFIIGNSSAGIREAPIYGVPTIDIGSRQNNRSKAPSILHCQNNTDEILTCINQIQQIKKKSFFNFGKGQAAQAFLKVLQDSKIWQLDIQKKFNDL